MGQGRTSRSKWTLITSQCDVIKLRLWFRAGRRRGARGALGADEQAGGD